MKRDISGPNAYNRLKIGTHLPWDIPQIWFKGTIRFRGRLRPLRSFDLGRGQNDMEVTWRPQIWDLGLSKVPYETCEVSLPYVPI